MLALALQLLAGAAPVQARAAPESFADMVETLLPVVVNIQTQQLMEGGQAEQFEEFLQEFFARRGEGGEPQPQPPRGSTLGTALILDQRAQILTHNTQVVADHSGSRS